MYLGVDYYPEHWPKEFMTEDLLRIAQMNANIIRIGEFAWHLMEPQEGKFDFSFFDEVVEKARSQNLMIMFGTPTATFPAWLSKKYPEILSEDAYGNKRVFGGRRQYCFNSFVYNKYAKIMTKKLVAHYADEPQIIAWQIDNELGHEGSDLCYCQSCEQAFRRFLKDKYGSISVLNETYGTIFWGQTYNDFDEIPLPKPTITTHNPSLRLDHERFRSESIYQFAKSQIEVVRAFKGEHQKVTHNFSGGFFSKSYDLNAVAKELDFVSYDNYPVWGGLKEPLPPSEISMTLAYVRGLTNQNFWIVEELMGAQGHDVIGYLPRPNQALLWAYQAFCSGCHHMLFFRYRGMDKGAEQFCYGIIDQDNGSSRKYKEVQGFFNEVREFEEAFNTEIKSEVAIVYDYDNMRSFSIQAQSVAMDFKNELMRVYKPFHDRNVTVDVINIEKPFDAYKIIAFPVMQIIDAPLKDKIDHFVRNGGTVLFTFRSGLKDKNNNIHFGIKPPGLIADLVGAYVDEIESLQNEVPLTYDGQYFGDGAVFRDLIKTNTAKGILYYGDTPYDNYAALTVNTVGQGKVYYLGTGGNETVMAFITERLLQESEIESIESPPGVEIIKRGQKTFTLNHNDFTVRST